MSVAWVGVAVSAAGLVAGQASAKKSMRQQQSQMDSQMALAQEQLDAQVRQADEMMSFNRQVYDEGRARQVGVDAINRRVVDQSLRIAQAQEDRANDQYEFYQRTGRPMVERAINDAQTFDSEEKIQQARGRAAADAEQGYAGSMQAMNRGLARLGINPNSGKFMALQQRLAMEKAGAVAGAANQADFRQRAGAVQMRQGAANLAQGIPSQSMQLTGQAMGGGGAAVNAANAGVNQNMALAHQALGSMAQGANIYGDAARGFSNLAGFSANQLNTISNNAQQNAAGWGNLAGMSLNMAMRNNSGGGGGSWASTGGGASGWGSGLAFGNQDLGLNFADGGLIKGPGTGTSDSVPAVNGDTGQPIRLSNNEYIISADVVKAKGREFFDNLQKRYHTPVNLRAA